MKPLDPKRILVVGDVMLDRYVYGRVERISQEAPVPVLEEVRTEYKLGGAGNVVANLSAMGATTALAGLRGRNDESLLAHSRRFGVTKLVPGGLQSTTKTRFVSLDGHQVFRCDADMVAHGVLPEEREEQLACVRQLIEDVTPEAIIISDYGKGVVTREVVEACLEPGVPVVVDPSKWARDKWSWLYAGATALTPNVAEFPAPDSETDYGSAAVLVTRGGEGMCLNLPSPRAEIWASYDIPAIPVPVADVTGAGDTVTAALALCLANDWDMLEAARFANAAASVVVAKPGTATCSLAEATQVYRQHYECKAAAE